MGEYTLNKQTPIRLGKMDWIDKIEISLVGLFIGLMIFVAYYGFIHYCVWLLRKTGIEVTGKVPSIKKFYFPRFPKEHKLENLAMAPLWLGKIMLIMYLWNLAGC